MTPSAKRWVELAEYDLDTARSMMNAGRYIYVLFCCQQAVEKILKALITEHSAETPLRTHNLPRLAQVAAAQISDEQAELLKDLTSFYIQNSEPLPRGVVRTRPQSKKNGVPAGA